MDIAFLIVLGIVGGLIAGLLGLGGGIFYILIFPYLMEARGVPDELLPQYVIANSLFGIVIASGISMLGYQKKGQFPLKDILVIAASSAFFAYLSLHFIVMQTWFSKPIFNGLIIALMLFILFKMYLDLHVEKKEGGQINTGQGILGGGLSGIVSAVSGLGGGVIIIPLLTMRYKVSIVRAKTISLAMIFISSLTMSINNLLTQPELLPQNMHTIGYIIPSCIIPVAIGVLIGSPLGVKWSTTLKRKYLDLLFMLFVFLVLAEKTYSLIQTV